MRERMAQHRANPACASCHAMMDPLGLSLENFDMVGRWRDVDEALDADRRIGCAAGRHEVRGPAGLRDGAAEPSRSVRQDADREDADLRARPRARVLRHAGGAQRSCATRPGSDYRASSLVARHRQQSALPDAETAVMIITKNGVAPADVPARHRRHVGAAAARRDGAGIFGDRAEAPRTRLPAGLHLRAQRRGDERQPSTTGRRKASGADFELSPILAPLAPVSRSPDDGQRAGAEAGGVARRRQRRAHARLRDLAHRRASEEDRGRRHQPATTADQIAAAQLGKETVLPSLEMTRRKSISSSAASARTATAAPT